MDFDPVLLSRIQFALNISFHILFPTSRLDWLTFYCFFEFGLPKPAIRTGSISTVFG